MTPERRGEELLPQEGGDRWSRGCRMNNPPWQNNHLPATGKAFLSPKDGRGQRPRGQRERPSHRGHRSEHRAGHGNGHAAVPVNGNGHRDEASAPQQSLFSWAEFMAEEPVQAKGRSRKPQPATASLFEWALSLEPERERPWDCLSGLAAVTLGVSGQAGRGSRFPSTRLPSGFSGFSGTSA